MIEEGEWNLLVGYYLGGNWIRFKGGLENVFISNIYGQRVHIYCIQQQWRQQRWQTTQMKHDNVHGKFNDSIHYYLMLKYLHPTKKLPSFNKTLQ